MMEEQIIALITNLQQAIEGVAPTAWAALVLSAFMKSVLSFTLLALVLWGDIIIYRHGGTWWERVSKADMEIPYFIVAVLFGVANFIAIVDMFYATTWIGLFDSESRAILDLINLVN